MTAELAFRLLKVDPDLHSPDGCLTTPKELNNQFRKLKIKYDVGIQGFMASKVTHEQSRKCLNTLHESFRIAKREADDKRRSLMASDGKVADRTTLEK
jgi:hypothetical protein